MFNNDKPIESSSQDLLGTKSFADSLFNAILSYKEKDSLSVGMYGSWGTGKKSIVNMTLECIANATKDYAKSEKPIIINFNPWNFSDQNQLITQYFEQLALDKKEHGKDADKIGKKLILYSKLLAEHEHLINILYRWKEWGDEKEVKDFVTALVKVDGGLVKFVTGFLGKTQSHGMSNYVSKSEWRMRLEDIGNFLEVKEIEPCLRKYSIRMN